MSNSGNKFIGHMVNKNITSNKEGCDQHAINGLLIVFLYKLLKDLSISNKYNSKISKLLDRILNYNINNIHTNELLKEFIPNLELFLGNTVNFKNRLTEAMQIVQKENFCLKEFLASLLLEFHQAKELH